jgi:hypothetical protein
LCAAILLGAGLAARAAGPAILLTVDRDNTHKGSGGDRTRMVQIDINVRNAATNALSADLEWYFVSSPIGAFGYYISSQGKEALKLPALQAASVSKATPRFVEKQLQVKGGKTAKMNTAEVTGYIVRVVVDGKVAALRAEPQFIQRKAADPEEFKQLLSNKGPP